MPRHKFRVVGQTTIKQGAYERVCEVIKSVNDHAEVMDTLCSITTTRQEKAFECAKNVESEKLRSTRSISERITVKDGDELAVTFKVEVEKDTSGEAIINKANIKDGVNKSGVNTNETNNQTHPKKEVFDKDDDTTNIDRKQVKPREE